MSEVQILPVTFSETIFRIETYPVVMIDDDSIQNERIRILNGEEISEVQRKCSELPEYDSVISVGMGGSIRGAVAITDILGDVRHFVANSPEKDRLDSIIERCEKPILHLSSKSGETIETISCYDYMKDLFEAQNRTVVTTSENSRLATYARENDIILFESTEEITGRFSAFSYYGIVPSYLCGVNVKELCTVARNQMFSETESYNLGIQIADLVDKKKIYYSSVRIRIVLKASISGWCNYGQKV